MPGRNWSPDSWLKIIVVGLLGAAFGVIVIAMAVRALVPSYNVESAVIGDTFSQFMGLFGVVVGYVLGSKSKGE